MLLFALSLSHGILPAEPFHTHVQIFGKWPFVRLSIQLLRFLFDHLCQICVEQSKGCEKELSLPKIVLVMMLSRDTPNFLYNSLTSISIKCARKHLISWRSDHCICKLSERELGLSYAERCLYILIEN